MLGTSCKYVQMLATLTGQVFIVSLILRAAAWNTGNVFLTCTMSEHLLIECRLYDYGVARFKDPGGFPTPETTRIINLGQPCNEGIPDDRTAGNSANPIGTVPDVHSACLPWTVPHINFEQDAHRVPARFRRLLIFTSITKHVILSTRTAMRAKLSVHLVRQSWYCPRDFNLESCLVVLQRVRTSLTRVLTHIDMDPFWLIF